MARRDVISASAPEVCGAGILALAVNRLRRRLIGLTVGVLGIGAAGDFVALQLAESRAAEQVAQSLAASDASVSLGGFPFLPSVLTGSVAPIHVEVTGASAAGLRVDRIVADAADLRFNTSEAFRLLRSRFAGRTELVFSDVEVELTFTEQDLRDFLKPRVARLDDLTIKPSGVEVVFRLPGGAAAPPARVLPRVVNDRISLVLVGIGGLPAEIIPFVRDIEGPLDLPPIPTGLSTDVGLGDGVFVIGLNGDQVTREVGEGSR